MSFFLEVVQSAFSPVVLFYMFAGVAAGMVAYFMTVGTIVRYFYKFGRECVKKVK